MKRLLAVVGAAVAAWAVGSGCATEPPRDPPFDEESPLEPGEEFAFGRSIAARLSTGVEFVEDAKARAYVARVGGVVAAASRRPDPYDGYRFYIVQDPRVSTFSAPGGFVFVTTGALKALKDEDALAGLLAQEMAHCALGHALADLPVRNVRPTRESWPNTPEWGPEVFREICDTAAGRSRQGWSEAQELEASEWARAALGAAGYVVDGAGPETRAQRFAAELAAVR